MIEALLSLPTLLGCLLFMGLTTSVGLMVYYVTFRLQARRQSDDAMKEIGEATSNLMRVVGWLLTLLLSLTFTDVVGELALTETAIEGEAAAISDIHHNLRRFGPEETRENQTLLVDYTRAVIDDDWPALAHGRLPERADALLRQLEDVVLDLKATGATQETLRSRAIADVDMISDYRLSRLQQAREQPSPVLIVVFFGYLVTMVCFGVYRPRRVVVGLMSFYTAFVGVVIYLILAMSDPFQGATAIDSAPLEYVLETMRGSEVSNHAKATDTFSNLRRARPQHISNEGRTIHMDSSRRQTVKERSELGKSLRKQAPRTSHAEWSPGSARPDPIGLLEEQNKNRLDWLVPVRRARMMASPFAFYRGGARIMAADLATTPVTGLMVQACGDAHLANFGLFASPERKLVFDLNDFDETLEGPWEWDLKRLVASFAIAARHNEFDRDTSRKATGRVVQSYREAMNDFAEWRTTDIWYALINEEDYVAFADRKSTEKRGKKTIAKAKTKHSRQVLDRLAEDVDGEYRIKSEPPLLVPLRELRQKLDYANLEHLIREGYEAYVRSVSPDCRVLLKKYQPVDFGLKVVGVGSVGTRCWILLLVGRDRDDPLFLQMKEATYSVLAEHLHPSPYENHGRRVVEGQRLMQTANDVFLGWTHTPETGHDFYWRQLRDWKGSVDIDGLEAADLHSYARLCGWTLARTHARSGDPVAIAGYLGTSDTFDQAQTEFAARYADQNERDYEAFLGEIRSGRLEVAPESS